MLTKKQLIEVNVALINHIGIYETAEFLYYLQKAVRGLTKNNESYQKAYRSFLENEGKPDVDTNR